MGEVCPVDEAPLDIAHGAFLLVRLCICAAFPIARVAGCSIEV